MKVIPVMGPLSGSLGGFTASHNKGGAYFRQRVIPTDPNSTRQQIVRAAMSSMVQRWTNTLTALQRAGWDTYGQNVEMTDVQGQSLFLSGQQQYLRTNVARVRAGLGPVDTAPTIFDLGEPVTGIETTTGAVDDTMGELSGAWSTNVLFATATSEIGVVIVQLGPPINSTRNFFKGPFQLSTIAGVTASSSSQSIDTASAAQLQADILTSPQYRAMRSRVAYDDGRLSTPFTILANVVDDT